MGVIILENKMDELPKKYENFVQVVNVSGRRIVVADDGSSIKHGVFALVEKADQTAQRAINKGLIIQVDSYVFGDSTNDELENPKPKKHKKKDQGVVLPKVVEEDSRVAVQHYNEKLFTE